MKKKLLSVFMVLCLMLAMLPAAFADETEPTDLSSQIASAIAGETIYLDSGTYVISSRVAKPVSLVANDGADVTIYGDVVYGNGSWTDVTGEAAKTITISGIDFVKGNETCNLAICLSSGVSGYTLNVESCTFSDYEYGVTANSGATGNTIRVYGNSEFNNVGCALSLQSGNTLGSELAFSYDGFVVQYFATNEGGQTGVTTNVYYSAIEDYADDVANGDYSSGISVVGDENAVVLTEAQLRSAVNSQSAETIYIGADITLTSPIEVASGSDITINGLGHTISYPLSVNRAFNIPSSAQDTSLTIDDVTFTITDGATPPTTGFGVVVGEATNGVSVSVADSKFNNIYSGVYFGHLESGSTGNLSITDCEYNNSLYGYSVDEVTDGSAVNVVDTIYTGNTGATNVEETWDNIVVTNGDVSTAYDDWDSAFEALQPGGTLTLNMDVELSSPISITKENVTIDGNGHEITYTGSVTSGSFITVENGTDNVTIKNVTIDSGTYYHGVQFYCVEGGELNGVTVDGGNGTSVMVNGSTNIEIRNCTLNTNGYAHIEYGMGGGVTTIPSIIVEDNVFGTAGKAQIWADQTTTGRVEEAMGNNPTNAQIREKIMHSITNEGVTNVVVTMQLPNEESYTNVTSQGNNIVVPTPHAITITQPANGTVSTSLSNASKGAVITVTAKPNTGYELAYITVNGEKITGNTFVMPDEAVTVSAVFVTSSFPFTDVATGAWYYEAVNYVYTNGLMDGVSDTTFNPDGSMTRAMVWAILARMDGQTVTGANWATVARNWAVREGVSDGENANGLVTREQLATMIWRYVGEPKSTYSLSAFTDAGSVSDWASTAMAWAVEHGIITGVTATTLVPQGTATRAQCAAILMRCVEL